MTSPSHPIFYYAFGSWTKALQVAGIPLKYAIIRKPHIDNKVIVRKYIGLIKRFRRWPKRDKVKSATGLSISTISKKFGSLSNLYTEIASQINLASYISRGSVERTMIMRQFKRFIKHHKRLPKTTELNRQNCLPTHNTINKYFGSFYSLKQLLIKE